MIKENIILIPVYNDWQALSETVRKTIRIFAETGMKFPFFLIVNDGSTDDPSIAFSGINHENFLVLNLYRNLGHQKAIVIGLAYLHHHAEFEKVIIMDADGEDRPENIKDLLAVYDKYPNSIVLAKRTKRTEGAVFLSFYWFYKLFFLLLTGRKMAYGNFSIMPHPLVSKLVYFSEIWNNVAGGIMKSGLPFVAIPIAKGKRYQGVSKMNFTSLIIHGLNTISVFIETISVRILILSTSIILISLVSILVITAIRLFTPYAIPGWASVLASSMLVILLQSFLISLVMIVIFLSSQSQRKLIPAHDYRDYIRSHKADDES